MKTLLGITASLVVIMLPIDASVLAHTTQHHVYQNVNQTQSDITVVNCKFDSAPIEEKIVLWLDMTPRHRDFHWRQMSAQDRHEFKKMLPLGARQSMTHRYAPKKFYDGMTDVPRGWHKRLTKEERMILREQIVHAQKNLLNPSDKKTMTPAESESEMELRVKIKQLTDRMHSECIVFSFSQNVRTAEPLKEELFQSASTPVSEDAIKPPAEIGSLNGSAIQIPDLPSAPPTAPAP